MNYNEEQLERPPWTLFFEGTLYRRYLRYLQHHDLSQMLNNGNTNSYQNAIQPPVLTHETSWYPQEKYPSEDDMPPAYHSRLASMSSERSNQTLDYKIIKQRTRILVCVGITLMALAAAIVALTIHYVYIETGKTVPVIESGHIHIPGNFTANETMAILQDNETSIIDNKHTTGRKEHEFEEIELEFVSKDPDVESYLRDDPSSTTPIKQRPAFTPTTVLEESFEWFPTTSQKPLFEPVLISDVETTIGKKKASMSCVIRTVDWDFAYLEGKTVTLNFTKSKNLKTTGINSKFNFDYDFIIMDGSDMTEIRLQIIINDIECDDQGTFHCGLTSNLTMTDKHAELIVKRKPTSYIRTKQPVGIIEGQTVELEATWKGGYPRPVGNISWFYASQDNITEIKPFKNGDISWRMKINENTCKTYINTIVKFIPTMEMNDTILYAVSTFPNVHKGDEKILVIPATYCDDASHIPDVVYKPHPYTCKKFVRCRAELIDVYECPKDMCFSQELAQCDILTKD